MKNDIVQVSLVIRSYIGAHAADAEVIPLSLSGTAQVQAQRCPLTAQAAFSEDGDALRGSLEVAFTGQTALPTSVSLEFSLKDWIREDYLLMPAAVYAGNRFCSVPLAYPPYAVMDPAEALDPPVTVTDIPRLSDTDARSRIQLLAGDLSTPAIGCFSPENRRALLLLTEHETAAGYTGLFFEEDLGTGCAVLRLSVPGVREDTQYVFANNRFPSTDRGVTFRAGERIHLPFCLYAFPADTVDGLYARLFEARREFGGNGEAHCVPFSAAYHAIRDKYERCNYDAADGYYRVGVDGNPLYNDWQTGWVGGGIVPYVFLHEHGLPHQHALNNLRFLRERLQRESGHFVPMYSRGREVNDTFGHVDDRMIALTRRDADLLFYLTKSLPILRRCGEGLTEAEQSVRQLADAFAQTFARYGQFGQFIDIDTGEIVTGGTAAAGLAPGALMLAADWFDDDALRDTARQAGEYYYRTFTARGLTNGGPCEIAQCPDSESAFALLESDVLLYEATGDGVWLARAEEAARQAASWVVSYNFHMPANSLAGRLGLHTTGAVFANAQNKHAAPGICTMSGDSLLRLYRYTGKTAYLELLRDIAHAIPQFVSLAGRRLMTWDGVFLPEGFINERVQLSDWEGWETIGEVRNGSCWPEVSMLLTYIEVPGIYADRHSGLVMALDHVDCTAQWRLDGSLALDIHNPTRFDAEVRILVDGDPADEAHRVRRVAPVPASETVTVTIA